MAKTKTKKQLTQKQQLDKALDSIISLGYALEEIKDSMNKELFHTEIYHGKLGIAGKTRKLSRAIDRMYSGVYDARALAKDIEQKLYDLETKVTDALVKKELK